MYLPFHSTGHLIILRTLNGLHASTWQTLRNAVMAEQWPLDQKERRAMFTKLRDEHAGSSDRVGFLINAFKAVDPDAESFLKAESKGDEL